MRVTDVKIVHSEQAAALAGKCWQALDRAGIPCETVLDPFAATHLWLSGEGEPMDRACEIVARLVKEHNR